MGNKIIGLGEFAPDSQDFDNPSLEIVENAIPMYGGYRGHRAAKLVSSQTPSSTAQGITGAYAHLITEDVAVLHNKVDATDAAGEWFDVADMSTDDLHDQVNEATPDENTRIACRDAAQNPTFTKVQLGFPSITDPAVASSSNHHLDLRYRGFIDSGTASLTADIYMGTAQVTTNLSWTASVSTASTNWVYKRVTLNATDVDTNLTDWTDLSLHISGSISGMSGANADLVNYPDSDADNSDLWLTNAESTDDLYLSIDDVQTAGGSPSTASHIKTPALGAAETKTYKCDLTSIRDPYANTAHELKYHIKSGVAAGVDLAVKLMEDATTIASTTHTDVGTAWGTETLTLTTAEADSIENYGNLSAEFAYSYDGGGGGTQYARPNSDVSVGSGWTVTAPGGSTSNLYLKIDEVVADDATTQIYHLHQGGASTNYKMTCSSISEPEDHTNTKVFTRSRYSGGTSLDRLKVRIYYNSGASYYEKDWGKITWIVYTDKVWTLTEAQSQNLDWGTDFTVELVRYGVDNVTANSRYTQVYVSASEASPQGFIADVWTEILGTQGLEVSWQDFVTPDSQTEVRGDTVKIYAGNRERLYGIDDGIWDNKTRTSGGDYGQGTTTPQAWDFCSWGGNVIATNREDDVQLLDLEAGATDFAKLIDAGSDITPKAKFCDIVQNHLVLTNINLASYFSYSVVWSHINNPTKFSVADYVNLSDIQHMRQKPGEITGFVGGEYGTLFKRGSIHRMSWVGGNLIFRFDTVALGIGTAHPQSIVTVDDDIYFYGHNNFYVMPSGGKPVPISIGKIQQMLLESQWEERALKKYVATIQVQHDLNIVGAYDMLSGLIFWAVNNNQENSLSRRKSDIIVYNPSEQKWGYIRDATFSSDTTKGISTLIASPNIQEDTGYLLINFHVFAHDSTGSDALELYKFSEDRSGPIVLKTNVISTAAIAQDLGRVAILKRIRPIFSRIGSKDYPSDSGGPTFVPRYSIVAYSSNDPNMIDDVQSATVTNNEEDRSGWANVTPLDSGEFWQFQITIPDYAVALFPVAGEDDDSSSYGLLKNVISLQVDMEPSGTR